MREEEEEKKFSVIKTLRAIDDCNVAVLVIDARESVSEQDLGLLSYIISAGRSLVICVNKWDGLSQDQKEKIKIDLQLKLGFGCGFNCSRVRSYRISSMSCNLIFFIISRR